MKPVLAFRRTPGNYNSLPSLVGALERAGLDSRIELRLAGSPAEVRGPDAVLAYSFTTPALGQVAEELSGLKGRAERPVLIAGGAHPSADPEGCAALGFDLVVVGEGECALVDFVRDWLSAGTPQRPQIRRGAAQDLDSSLHVAERAGLFPFVEISRGCDRQCAFCQTPPLFGRMRHRSPETVAAGVRVAVRAGKRRFRFLSPDAFAYGGAGAGARLDALGELLERCRAAGARQLMLGSFPSEVRPDSVEPALLELVRARCDNRSVVVGAQAGSDALLGRMRRGHTAALARRAVELCLEAGLNPLVDVLFGFPSETPDERASTLDLVRWVLSHRRAAVHAHYYIPLPGTRAWPDAPAPLEPKLRAALAGLQANDRLEGDWQEQIALGRQILDWRERGLIRV
ncbi:MAG: TIGR04013 family B12-binding domain/radical SAM domain-containing protein [Deltaproteobacteria bacterium]|nr:TIGR04013 family B12-binding domain/radical SAM domain-containing protein [Deltaproteobacteria bacterium]